MLNIALVGALVGWLFVIPSAQPTPSFSGHWTKVGSPAETIDVTQDATSLSAQSGKQRWRYTLDGADSHNAVEGQGGTVIDQIWRARWEGATLVLSHDGRSAQYGPFTVRMVWSLDGVNLVIASSQVNRDTSAVIFEEIATFTKQTR